MPCKSIKLASYLPFRRFQLRCRSHFQLHQILKMMFFSFSFPVFPKRFTGYLKIWERGSRILKTVNNLSYADIHITILLSLCRNISLMFFTTLHANRGRNKRDSNQVIFYIFFKKSFFSGLPGDENFLPPQRRKQTINLF